MLVMASATAQCDQDYDWAVWDGFTGNSSTGTLTTDQGTVSVTMTANYGFTSSFGIYGYGSFSGFAGAPADAQVPQTDWAIGPNGETTMCFSETVSNPVLLIASLGNNNEIVTLQFSNLYNVVFDGGGMTYPNDSTLIGQEGYAIIVFPGEFDCVTIFSSTPETYTNITWGLNPPLFDVTVEEISALCGSVTWNASGGTTYSWSGGTDPDSPTNTFTESGDYILTVTDDLGCTVVTSISVVVPPGTTTTSNTTAEACESYTWNGETFDGSGTYQFQTENAEGCDSVATLVLTIHHASTAESSVNACDAYIWNGDTLTSSGEYQLETTTVDGCDSTATLLLTISHPDSATIEVTTCDTYTSPDGTVLEESGVYEALIVTNSGCDSLLTIGLTLHFSELTTEPRYTCDPLDTDTATFAFTNIHGCDSLHLVVPVQYPDSLRAVAAFTTDPSQVEIPDGEVATINLSQNADDQSWDLGDGSPSINDFAPSHVYTDPGLYPITLIVTNELGCVDTAIIQLLVFQDPLVFVPNCFTPDGNGVNELFQAVFNGPGRVRDMELLVFDRWGEELVGLSAPSDTWDGLYKGEPVQDGVYPWRLRYRMAGDSRARELRGHLTVLR